MKDPLDVRRLPVLNHTELRIFTSHLCMLMASGVDLARSLDTMSNSPMERFGPVAARLCFDLETGRNLSGAMECQALTFNDSYIRVVQVAELGGGLVAVLDRLSRRLEEQGKTRARVKGALIYPTFLIASAVLMVALMVYILLPMLLTVTTQAGVEPPYLTQLLMQASDPRWLAVVLGSCAAGWFLYGALRLDPTWGPRLQRLNERIPLFGTFFVNMHLASSLRELAFLLGTGIDILVALRCARRLAAPCLSLREAYSLVISEVREGNLLWESMEKAGTFPESVVAMVSVGEYGGDLATLLSRYVDILDQNQSDQLEQFVLLLEPLILIAMGLVIGLILLAAFLPIYGLIQL